MLDPIETNSIIRPTGLREIDDPFACERAVAVPSFEVHFACNHHVWRDDTSTRLHGLDCCDPFSTTPLNHLSHLTGFGRDDIRVSEIWPIRNPVSSKFQATDSKMPCFAVVFQTKSNHAPIIFHHIVSWQKPMLIQIKYPYNNHLFFKGT